MADINYVQLEAAAFLTDIDYQMMTAEQRGVYCSIIFYLYCNNGQIELNGSDSITLLSNQTTFLATISGYHKTGTEWNVLWGKIAHKFKITGKILTHKRVTAEIEQVKTYKRAKADAGRKGMASRWGDNTDITKESKVKESKVNISNYTLQHCQDVAMKLGIPDDQTEEFFHYYKAQGWRFGNGVPITSLTSAMVRWRKNQFRFEKEKPQSFTERDAAETNKARAAAKARFDKK